MPTARANELDSVITEVLSNVFKHAGVDARAWILLEQEADQLIITARDDGVGMSRQQLEEAADAGRLGVKQSIVGRIIDLGGTSTLHSAPGEGTEWEFRVPIGT
nr:ATP-binding protein [Brooklawnia cerclae]